MRYVNSLLVLRLLNVLFIFVLLYRLPLFFGTLAKWREYYFANERQNLRNNDHLAENNASARLRWRDVDVRKPPPLNSTYWETIRLNEFLFRAQFKCDEKRAVGGGGKNASDFELCFDAGFSRGNFKNALLVSGKANAGTSFERTLNASKWTLVLPKRSAIIDAIQADVVNIQYMVELVEGGHFPIDVIAEALRDEKFDVAKLDLYSPYQKDQEIQLSNAPRLVEQILQHLNTRQLLILVRLDGRRENAHNIIARWYALFYALFFRWHYALLGTRSTGACGIGMYPMGRHCEHRVTFVRHAADQHVHAVNDAPVFGMGSPVEEKLRLLVYLSSVDFRVKCSQPLSIGTRSEDEDFLPVPCLDNTTEGSTLKGFHRVVYLRQRRIISESQANWIGDYYGNISKAITLLYPEPSPLSFPASVQVIANSLSPNSRPMVVPGYQLDTFWLLRPFDEIFSGKIARVAPYERNLLAIDLDGAEWGNGGVLETFGRVKSCPTLRNFEQLLFRLRFWAIEESQNYRKIYLWFLRLEYCGFSKSIASRKEVDGQYFVELVTYKREKIIGY